MRLASKILIVLLLFIAAHAPWRLMVMVAETFVLSPGYIHTSPHDDQYWEVLTLEARLATMGWPVRYEASLSLDGTRAFGLTDPATHTITLDSTQHWNERFVTLAHEGGHVLQPGWVSRVQGEIFAESVAMLVAGDDIHEHARYLAPHRFDVLMFAMAEWRAIYHAAAVLTDR
jgi:hypothetical protein